MFLNLVIFLILSAFRNKNAFSSTAFVPQFRKKEECKKWHEDVIISQIKSLFYAELPTFPMERKNTQRCGSTRVDRISNDVTVTCWHVHVFLISSRFCFFLFLNSFCLLVNCSFRVKTERGKREQSGLEVDVTLWRGSLASSHVPWPFSVLSPCEKEKMKDRSAGLVCVLDRCFLVLFFLDTYATLSS